MIAIMGADVTGFSAAMKIVQSEMKTVGEGFKGMQEKVSKIDGKAITKFGDGLTSAGKKMSLLTAPIAAVGIAALKIGTDFESGMSAVQAVTGATGEDFEKLKGQARQLGADTEFSATQAAGAMEALGRAGFDTTEIMDAMPGLLDLSSSSAVDLGVAAEIASNTIRGFGLEAGEAGRVADVLAATAAGSNTSVESLGESFKNVAPVAATLGISMEDTAAAIGLLGDAGIDGSQAGNMLKRGLLNLASPTKEASKLMNDLGMEMFTAEGEMKSLPEVMSQLEDGLGDMTQQQKLATLEQLFGSQAVSGFAALLDAGSDKLGDFSDELSNSKGTAAEMAAVMNDNVAGRLKEMSSALEEAALIIFDSLQPAFSSLIEFVTKAAEWFQNLSPSVQNAAVIFGGLLVAIGPILMILGTLVSSLGTIITAFGAVSAAITAAGGIAGAFGAVLAVLTGPIGLAVAAIALLAIGTIALVKHFSADAIEPITRFGDDVSESTQKAVGAFMDMSEEADVALKELAWSQQEVTAEMAEDMKVKQQEITDTLLTAIGERHEQEIEATQAQFENLDTLSDEQKAAILEKTNQRYEEESEIVEAGNARINEIVQTAATEEREITSTEADEILAIRQGMTEQAVAVMSENEVEQKMILEKMKENSGTITALEAAEVVRNATEKKDGVIEEANDQYDETYKWAIRQRDELGTMSGEEAEAVISAAKEKRDESIKNAEDTHKNVVKEAKSQAKEHVNEVDWETGEILSKWSIFKTKTGQTFKDIGAAIKKGWNDAWKWTTDILSGLWNSVVEWFGKMVIDVGIKVKGIGTAVKLGFTTMKTDAIAKAKELVAEGAKKFIELKKKITDPIEEAKQKVSDIIKDIKGFFEGLKLKIPKFEMPKMPKFTMTGSFSLKPPSVPKLGVSWNAKGGIFNKPTVLNTAAGLQGFGEVPNESEAIIPLNAKVLGGIGAGIARQMSKRNTGATTNSQEVVINNDFTFNVDGNMTKKKMDEIAEYVAKQQMKGLRKIGHNK